MIEKGKKAGVLIQENIQRSIVPLIEINQIYLNLYELSVLMERMQKYSSITQGGLAKWAIQKEIYILSQGLTENLQKLKTGIFMHHQFKKTCKEL